MPQPRRSDKRDKGTPKAVEVIREFHSNLKAQARTLLILIGVSPEVVQANATPQANPAHGGDDAQGGCP
jgi:hypothetical protein